MFYDQLDEVCKRNGTTVSAVLISIGCSKGNIRNWKNGGIPKYETRLKIANHLGVGIDELLTDEELKERNKQVENIVDGMDVTSIQYAAYQELEGESEELIKDVINFIKFRKSQKNNE